MGEGDLGVFDKELGGAGQGTVLGVTVNPGDIIFADADGVVVVPQEVEDETFEKALAKFAKEEKLRERFLAGESTLEVYGFDKIIEQKQK